jgi:homoserine kinase
MSGRNTRPVGNGAQAELTYSLKVPRRAAAFAPATVSNVGCGFDVLGFALEEPGDVVVAFRSDRDGVEIVDISGDEGRLPRELERNTASLAVRELLRLTGSPQGAALVIRKGLPLASGIGSSAASAVAAVVAANAALQLGASPTLLLQSAMEGERASAGMVHPDNVAPALLGGFVLSRSIDPPDVVPLPVPPGLACAVLHPAFEIETRAARAMLPPTVPLRDAVRQWANVGALVAALHANDLDLLARAMVDHIVEPHRASLVPGFAPIKQAALEAGAIGCSLSGAGPSMFALCRSITDASRAADAMLLALQRHAGLEGHVFASRIAAGGARRVDAVD